MSGALHTVAVSLPGTPTRVLVERLQGTTDEARRAAKEAVYGFASAAPKQWATEVVATHSITDVLTEMETPAP